MKSFGKLGTTSPPSSPGAPVVKLARTVGDGVTYQAPPGGQGTKPSTWERDPLAVGVPAGSKSFVLEMEARDGADAISFENWRARVAEDFAGGTIRNLRTVGVRELANVADALFVVVVRWHAAQWRVGMLDVDNFYVVRPGAADCRVFLPDTGFTWSSEIDWAKPKWLKEEPRDALLWKEPRQTRQYVAPTDYLKAPGLVDWADLAQRDIRVVARLLKYALTGDVAGVEPVGSRCTLWKVIQAAEEGKYTDAVALREAVRVALKYVPQSETSHPPESRPWRLSAVLGGVLMLGLTTAIGVWQWGSWKVEVATSNDPEQKDVVEPVPPKEEPGHSTNPVLSPSSGGLESLETRVENVKDLKPEDKEVLALRAEILAKAAEVYAAIQKDHIPRPLESRKYFELLKRLSQNR